MVRDTAQHLRPRLVSFSGIDGAGKSTQIESLRARLHEVGVRVLLVPYWNNVARLTRLREVAGHTLFKGDKGVGTPARPLNRRDKNVRSWYMTGVRFFLYFVDAVSLRIVVAKARRTDTDVVIFDRYAYDELANLSPRNRITTAYIRLLLKFIPKPDIRFLLDADPVQARTRKPEYPIEFLHHSRESYFNLSSLVGGMSIIAPQSIQNAGREIAQEVLKSLSCDTRQAFPTPPQTVPSA